MGKTVSATDLLNAGRRRPPTRAETGTDQPEDATTSSAVDRHTATGELETQTLRPLVDQIPKPQNSQPTRYRDDQTPSGLADQASRRLDTQTTAQLDVVASGQLDPVRTSGLADEVSKRLNPTPNELSNQASKRLSAQSSRGSTSATYERSTVFLTPDQRRWVKQTAKNLPDGLSGSDIVRLAVARLTGDVSAGLDLVSALSAQAYSDAEVFAGRRNRGLPPPIAEAIA